MKKRMNYLPLIIAYFFILLFLYAAVSKILDFENFQVQIGQSPLLSAYAGFISYAVILVEMIIAVLLSFERSRKIGLYCSAALMSAFTIYIYLILNYSDFVPCSCGGILEKLGWTEHLIFNIVCVILGITAIGFEKARHDGSQKQSLIISGTANLLSIGIVIGLFFSSEHIIKEENNFTRRFYPNGLIEEHRKKLNHTYYYFAGKEGKNIYLGDITQPLQSKKLSDDLQSETDLKIKLDDYTHLFKNLRLQVTGGYYFLYDGSVPVIYRGKTDLPTTETLSYKQAYFNQLAAIDSTTFVFRTISNKTKAFTIGILQTGENHQVKMHPEILIRQTDGIFDSEGHLLTVQKENEKKIIYTYTYRNQIVVMNQSLERKEVLKTIDTTSIARVKTTTLSDGRSKMSAPPYKVNTLQTENGNYLFNHSNIMGKNESVKRWKSSSVIDLYNIESRTYVGSLYIPHAKDKKLSAMLATDDYLYAIAGNEIICYRFRDNVLKALHKKGKPKTL